MSRTRVTLGLKLDEVPLPSLARCQPGTAKPDPVCQPDAAHRPDPGVGADRDRGFECLEIAAGDPRCVKRCGVRDGAGQWQPNNELCRAGHVCADVGNDLLGPLCVEGPPPAAACTPGEARYQVQVGKGYMVASSALPFYSRVKEGEGGRCVPDEARPPQFVSRIPLSAPAMQVGRAQNARR